jgi:hypothetical protein
VVEDHTLLSHPAEAPTSHMICSIATTAIASAVLTLANGRQVSAALGMLGFGQLLLRRFPHRRILVLPTDTNSPARH